MSNIARIFWFLWELWFGLFFAVTLVLLYPVFYWNLSKSSRFPAAFNSMRFWAVLLQLGGGIALRIKKEAPLPEGAFVIAPNHSSYLDIPLTYRVFSRYFVFMGKAELASWPLFRIFFTRNMNITVDRKSRSGSARALIRAREEARKGHPIVIFPEGTIPEDTPNLKRFKPGAAKLAIDMQIPVVPVTYLTNHRLLSFGQKKARSGPGVSRVIVHKPIPTTGLTEADIPKLTQQVYATIAGALGQEV